MKDIYISFRNKAKIEGKSLYYMYNGTYLENDELTFNEISNSENIKRNKMNILVNEIEPQPKPKSECIIKYKNIICPEYKLDIKFKIEEYNILLYEYKNKHEKDKIYFDEFNSTQNIDISKIICDNCNVKYIIKLICMIIYFINVIHVK